MGRAADRREHRQARHRHRARSTASRSGRSRRYGDDRVFVRLALAGAEQPDRRRAMPWPRQPRRPATRSSGSSSPTRSTSPREFVRWEVATAIAGAVLGIDPFDQPNVEEAKELTRDAARRPRPAPAHASRAPIVADGGLALYGDAPLRLSATATGRSSASSRRHLARRRPNAYLAIQAFIAPDARRATRRSRGSGRCSATRPAARRPPATGRASSTRPASSTRAAPPTGWFLQLTADHPDRPADPGLAVHVRTADRRPGPGRLRGDRGPRPADRAGPPRRPGDGPAALEAALAEALLGT